MQALVVKDLREHGAGTAEQVAARLGLPLAHVRGALARLAPPPVGSGGVVVLGGDRFAMAPAMAPEQVPEPPSPCRMRQSGEHAGVRTNYTGARVCSACGERV